MAAAAGVEAIDSISTAIRDADALAETCDTARTLGYAAKMAIHPGQIETINQRLAPDPDTIAWAARVQALAREHPEQSVFSLDGRMIDQPHLEVARRILARAGCRHTEH
jgi:citrate lyase subunit beta/citryl-CoA lyase